MKSLETFVNNVHSITPHIFITCSTFIVVNVFINSLFAVMVYHYVPCVVRLYKLISSNNSD